MGLDFFVYWRIIGNSLVPVQKIGEYSKKYFYRTLITNEVPISNSLPVPAVALFLVSMEKFVTGTSGLRIWNLPNIYVNTINLAGMTSFGDQHLDPSI